MNVLKIFIVVLVGSIAIPSVAQNVSPETVKADMKRVADWQVEHFSDEYHGRRDFHNHPLAWNNAALYIGMTEWADMADDDLYWKWMKDLVAPYEWKLHDRIYHADDHAIGQLYVKLYRKYGDKAMLKPAKESLRYINFHPAQTDLLWDGNKNYKKDRWSWCDAFYMSPPLWAMLYKETGKEMYLDFMMEEFKATTDYLFDTKENLYFRDQSYMDKLENGKKVFWSRGNGWVIGGLVNIMNELDADTKEYKYFLKIYKKMAKRLIELQTEKGHWAMSLLNDEGYPTPETSGTGFYIYGLAWGVNNGILDKETYEPAVLKGWNALTSHITKEGMLGYVQPIGAAPGKAWADKTEVYGTGAFLAAGSEVYEMVGGQ